MTKESRWLALFAVVAVAPALQAGQLKMRAAAVVDGIYAGGDQRTVRFQSEDSETGRYGVSDTPTSRLSRGRRRRRRPRFRRRTRPARRRR